MKRLVHIIHQQFALFFPGWCRQEGNKSGNVRTKWHDEFGRNTHFWWGKPRSEMVSGATRGYFHRGSATRAVGAPIRFDFSRLALWPNLWRLGPARKM